MTPRALRWLAALSLIALAGAVMLWIASSNIFVRGFCGRVLIIIPEISQSQAYSNPGNSFATFYLPYDVTEMYRPTARTNWRAMGFELLVEPRATVVAAPALALALVPAAVAAASIVALRRHSRWQGEGRCAGCGYDLRGSTGDRCPECDGVI